MHHPTFIRRRLEDFIGLIPILAIALTPAAVPRAWGQQPQVTVSGTVTSALDGHPLPAGRISRETALLLADRAAAALFEPPTR